MIISKVRKLTKVKKCAESEAVTKYQLQFIVSNDQFQLRERYSEYKIDLSQKLSAWKTFSVSGIPRFLPEPMELYFLGNRSRSGKRWISATHRNMNIWNENAAKSRGGGGRERWGEYSTESSKISSVPGFEPAQTEGFEFAAQRSYQLALCDLFYPFVCCLYSVQKSNCIVNLFVVMGRKPQSEWSLGKSWHLIPL